jgi:heptosyltransferase-1
MNSFLIVKTSSLGDVMHMMPALADARRAHPNAHIAWLVDEMYAPLVRLAPAVDEVLLVSWRRWRRHLQAAATWREMRAFVERLRARRYDAVIDTQGLVHSGSMARLAIGTRHGYDSRSIREPLAARLYDVRHRVSRALPAVVRNRQLTGLALDYSVSDQVDYGLRAAWQPPAVRGMPYALLVHATARPQKAWPASAWRGLTATLERRGFRVVLPAGSEADYERAVAIADGLPHTVTLPALSLERTIDIILGASLVVGVDTGLMHLAVALGVPTVAIFSATDPALTGPIGNGPVAIAGSRNHPATVAEVEEAVALVLDSTVVASAAKFGLDRGQDAFYGDVPHAPAARVAGRRA